MNELRGCYNWSGRWWLGFVQGKDYMCGLERDFRLIKEEKKKDGRTYEDTRTWNLIVPIRYKLLGSFSKWLGYYDLLKS